MIQPATPPPWPRSAMTCRIGPARLPRRISPSPRAGAIFGRARIRTNVPGEQMKALRLGLCIFCLVSGAGALAAQGPPGVAEPLGAGPFTYRTGEGLNIRVTVLTRLTSPYAIAFLPNGDMLVTQRTGELKRIPRGSTTAVPVAGGPKSLGPVVTTGVHGYMGIALHPRFAQNGFVYLAYAKPQQQGSPRSIAIARARYADGSLHDTRDVFVGEGLGGPTTVKMTPASKLLIGTHE